MKAVCSILRRELASLFLSPVAYVFLVIFLLLTAFFPLLAGHFFQAGEASMRGVFFWHPWLFLLLVPAVGMSSWAEERRRGTLELLFSMPVTLWQAVIGKFLAGWCFLGIALLLTVSFPVSLYYLGRPELGPLLTGYLGSFCVAGVYLAVSNWTSSCTENQIVSFILSAGICLLLALAGYPPVTAFLQCWGPWSVPASWLASFSVVFHSEALQRGVLDARDLLYFFSVILCFLTGTRCMLSLHGGGKRLRHLLWWGGVAVFLLLLCAVCGELRLRWDCTAERRYTLSPVSRKVLRELPAPLVLRLYAGGPANRVPVGWSRYADRIGDLLKEYELAGGGRLRVEILHPRPDTDEADRALLEGIAPVPLPGGDVMYLGLSCSSGERKASLSLLQPEQENQLEYQITRLILAVRKPLLCKVGLLSSLPLEGLLSSAGEGKAERLPAWRCWESVQRNYPTVVLPQECGEIPEDVQIVVLVHPKALPVQTEQALDRFIGRGGRVLAFLDPLCLADLQQRRIHPKLRYLAPTSASDLPNLLKAWGLTFSSGAVLLDRQSAAYVRTDAAQEVPVPLLNVLELGPGRILHQDPAMGGLSQLHLLNVGVFRGTPASSLKQEILLESGGETQLVEPYATQRKSEDMLRLFQPEKKKYPLAIRLSGLFPAAFPENTEGNAPRKEAMVVLVGDVDMLYDPFCFRKQKEKDGKEQTVSLNQNQIFWENLLESLTGEPALFSIRTRNNGSPPLEKLRQLERQAMEQYRQERLAFEAEQRAFQLELQEFQKRHKEALDQGTFQTAQKELVEKIRRKEGEMRRRQRLILRNQRAVVERMEHQLVLWNLLAMPLVVICGGMAVALLRRLHCRRSVRRS